MADREKYIDVLSKTAKTVKEFNEDAPIKISLECIEDILELLKEQEEVVHCGDCENFCFDNISPNAGRCMLTNMSHSKTWFCAHGKREEGREVET